MFTTSEIILGLCDSDSNTARALRWLEFGNVVVWMYLSEHTQLPHYQEISIIMGDEIFTCFQRIFNMFHSKITLTSSQDLKIIYETYLGSSSVSDDWSFLKMCLLGTCWQWTTESIQVASIYMVPFLISQYPMTQVADWSNIPLHCMPAVFFCAYI